MIAHWNKPPRQLRVVRCKRRPADAPPPSFYHLRFSHPGPSLVRALPRAAVPGRGAHPQGQVQHHSLQEVEAGEMARGDKERRRGGKNDVAAVGDGKTNDESLACIGPAATASAAAAAAAAAAATVVVVAAAAAAAAASRCPEVRAGNSAGCKRTNTPPPVGPWCCRNFIPRRRKLRQNQTGLPDPNPKPIPAWHGGLLWE